MRLRTRGHVDVDTNALTPLLEESQDRHADSMVTTTESLHEMIELGHENRSARASDTEEAQAFATARDRLMPGTFGGKLLGAAGAGAALATLLAGKASARSPS